MIPSAIARTNQFSATGHNLSREELTRAENRARRFWMAGICGMLGLQVLIGVGSVFLAVGDPSVAIVPNYHQAALDWDATQRARHMTARLGWKVVLDIAPLSADSDKRLIRVAARDAAGKPIGMLNITAKVYHHARGSEIYEMQFTEVETGDYEARTSLVASGIWQFQLQMEGDHGIASQSSEIWAP